MRNINFNGASWDSILLTFVKILTVLTSIILTKILSKGLSLLEYGTYSQANIIISITTSFLLLGLGDALNYFYNSCENENFRNDREKFINTIYFLEIIFGIILALILIILRRYIANYFSNKLLESLIIIISTKPFLDNLVYFYQILYVSIKKAKLIALRNLLIAIFKIIIIYVSINILKKLEYIFLLLILLDIFQLCFFKFYFIREGFLINPLKIKKEYIKIILAYSLPMGIFSITNALTRDIDKIIIGRLSTTEILAVYSNCSKLLPFDILTVSFATVLIPYITRYMAKNEKIRATLLFKSYIKIGYYSVWILGVSVLIVSKQVITFLYSEKYIIGNIVFIIYILDSMIRFASIHLILTAKGKTKLLMKYSIISLGINTILNIIGYKIFGIIGPAIATLITAIIYIKLVLNKTIEFLETAWSKVFDIKEILIFISILLFTSIVIFYFNKILLNMNVHQYISMIISMGIFIIINFLFVRKKIISTLKDINSLKL